MHIIFLYYSDQKIYASLADMVYDPQSATYLYNDCLKISYSGKSFSNEGDNDGPLLNEGGNADLS